MEGVGFAVTHQKLEGQLCGTETRSDYKCAYRWHGYRNHDFRIESIDVRSLLRGAS